MDLFHHAVSAQHSGELHNLRERSLEIKKLLLQLLLGLPILLGALEYRGYSGCTELKNPVSRVVIAGALGCRVLEFSYRNENAILVNPRHDGIHWESGPAPFEQSGARFDIGPELTAPAHDSVWLGTWSGRQLSSLAAEWESPPDPESPFRVTRKFELDPALPRLTITQTVVNQGPEALTLQYWGRAWFRPGGTVKIPLPPRGLRRFPAGYVQYESEARPGILNLTPEDPMIREVAGFLEIRPLPKFSKNTFECGKPFAIYELPYGQTLVVRFPIDPERASADIAGGNFCVCFNRWFCEMEALGPRELVAPGERFQYTESWQLYDTSRFNLKEGEEHE